MVRATERPDAALTARGTADTPMEGIDMTDHTTGWVTFHTIRTADGRILLVQKHPDGSSRTIIAASGARR